MVAKVVISNWGGVFLCYFFLTTIVFLLLSGKQTQQIQPRLTPRGFSVELLHTDSAEDTGLELGIVIIKKEHPSLLFHQKDALLVDYQYYTL